MMIVNTEDTARELKSQLVAQASLVTDSLDRAGEEGIDRRSVRNVDRRKLLDSLVKQGTVVVTLKQIGRGKPRQVYVLAQHSRVHVAEPETITQRVLSVLDQEGMSRTKIILALRIHELVQHYLAWMVQQNLVTEDLRPDPTGGIVKYYSLPEE